MPIKKDENNPPKADQSKTGKTDKPVAIKTATVATPVAAKPAIAGSVYAKKRADKSTARKRNFKKREAKRDEFDQRLVDIARVTRVMAGGKRMRFRATVAIGDKKGKIGIGMAKGADVALAVNKAVNNAKKAMIEVSIVNDTIPHEIFHKFGAAKVLLKPARQGRGVIAGGAIRMILELAGVKNVTSKNLGTNNKVTISKCLIEALDLLKKVELKKNSPKADQPKTGKTVAKTDVKKKLIKKPVAQKAKTEK